jgi:hypothetical protein
MRTLCRQFRLNNILGADKDNLVALLKQSKGLNRAGDNGLGCFITAHCVDSDTHLALPLLFFGLFCDFQGDIGIEVAAFLTGGVRELCLAALRAYRIIYRFQGMMRPARVSSALTYLFYW